MSVPRCCRRPAISSWCSCLQLGNTGASRRVVLIHARLVDLLRHLDQNNECMKAAGWVVPLAYAPVPEPLCPSGRSSDAGACWMSSSGVGPGLTTPSPGFTRAYSLVDQRRDRSLPMAVHRQFLAELNGMASQDSPGDVSHIRSVSFPLAGV